MRSGSENARNGQSDWEHWLRQNAPRFLFFARRKARLEADAQDLVQEAVVECWRRQPTGAPPAAALVFKIIRQRAIDLCRTQDRRAGREAVAAREIPSEWFESCVEDRERTRVIQQAMGRLPEMYRDVVNLKVWGDLTFAEIAEVLEIPANTAASRYRYGLAELRKFKSQLLP